MKPDDLKDERFDLEVILPLGLIRQHTKTDDIPSIGDELLKLYRTGALEAAEAYTGLLLGGKKAVTEAVKTPSQNIGSMRRYFNHNTRYPLASPLVWFYGFKSAAPQRLEGTVGSSAVRLPVMTTDFGMGCCSPCGEFDGGAKLLYHAGF
ncbi:MAG: hypothetical protein ACRCYS_08360, partial [Beijerinckiaceae bacterium]